MTIVMAVSRANFRLQLLPVLEELQRLRKIAPDKAVQKQMHWATRSVTTASRLCKPQTPDAPPVPAPRRTNCTQTRKY